jgi:soluble lytic murein transglycosylase-like protein
LIYQDNVKKAMLTVSILWKNQNPNHIVFKRERFCFMLNNLLKTCLLMFMLAFCVNLYAESYNITININGKEYYSDESGFSDNNASNNASVNSSPSPKAKQKSTGSSVPKHRGDSVLSMKKKKYADLIAKAADKHQVDAKLVHAVIQAESAYNATAISPVGAVGLMQLMPGTAKRYGVADRRDPYQNVDGGTRYLKHLLQLFDSDLNLTVAAYNAGENAVIKNNNAIPPYSETRHYVKEVLSLRKYMKHNSGSEYGVSRSTDTSEDWGNSGYTIEINYP